MGLNRVPWALARGPWWVRFSGAEQEKRETASIRNRLIPPQETQSSKGGTPKESTFLPEIVTESSTNLGTGNTEADVWEKAEMAKINERHEKLCATILDWENKKKTKAKRKMDKLEIELERRRAKATQHYRTKMEMIVQIAGRASAQAEQNRRKEEAQVKDKANRIRTTGKSPPTCFCF